MVVAISGTASAQNTISDSVCGMWENVMKSPVLSYRAQGIPIGTAESVFSSEEDVRTRVFLKQVTREIYAKPEAGRKYIESGNFRQDCVKTHRGY